MKKNQKSGKIILLIVLVIALIITAGITVYIGKNNKKIGDYKELLKAYYEKEGALWNDEVTVETLSETSCSATLKVSCPNTDECISIPNTLAYVENDRLTFKIQATLKENEIDTLNIPTATEGNILLSDIYEILGTNVEEVASSEILNTTYYGLIDNAPTYAVDMKYTCTNNSYTCLSTQEVPLKNGMYHITYLVQFSLDENNEMVVSKATTNENANAEVFKYEENPTDTRAYERELVKEYMVSNDLLDEDGNIALVDNMENVVMTCQDESSDCTNISTTALEEQENGYYLDCNYEFAVSPFNVAYISFMKF